MFPRDPLLGFRSSSEAAQAPSRCLGLTATRKTPVPNPIEHQPAAPPLRFRPLQRFPARSSGMMAGTTSPNRLRLQVLTTSWRFHPPRACRPCFMPDPLLGSPFRAFFLPRSRTLFPTSLPSWRSYRLQGLAPRESPPPDPAV